MCVKISSNSSLLLDANVYSMFSHNLLLYDVNEKCLLKIFFQGLGLLEYPEMTEETRRTKKNTLF